MIRSIGRFIGSFNLARVGTLFTSFSQFQIHNHNYFHRIRHPGARLAAFQPCIPLEDAANSPEKLSMAVGQLHL